MIRFALPTEIHRVRPAHEGHVLEAVVVRLPVEEIQAGEWIISRRRLGLVQAHELSRLLIRKWAQQNRIDNAEDRRICADTQGERKNGDNGESRRSAQPAQTIADILDESVHEPSWELLDDANKS